MLSLVEIGKTGITGSYFHKISRFSNSTRVDIFVYQHGKCFIFLIVNTDIRTNMSAIIDVQIILAVKQMFFPVSAARYKFISTVKRAKFWVADDNKFLI